MTRGRQRRVERPTGTGAVRAGLTFDEHRDDEQRKRRRQQPKRYVVHARKRHVRRADHQRHHPVAKSTHHRRHQREKDHDQAMAGYEHVVGMRVGENLQPRLLQFHPDHDGNDPTDQARADREHEVHRADVFVVGRIEIAPPAAGICVGFLVRTSNFQHSRHHQLRIRSDFLRIQSGYPSHRRMHQANEFNCYLNAVFLIEMGRLHASCRCCR